MPRLNALGITAIIFQSLLVEMSSANVEKPEKKVSEHKSPRKAHTLERLEGDGVQ